MSNGLKSVSIRNYRCLADLHLPLGDVNVLFGPNGSGKSTFLDALAFVRDCMVHGVDKAAADRGQARGLLPDDGETDEPITIGLETDAFDYQIAFGFSSGRIGAFPGERLVTKEELRSEIVRMSDADEAISYGFNGKPPDGQSVPLLGRFALDRAATLFEQPGAARIYRVLCGVCSYQCRAAVFAALRKHGSEAGYETSLADNGENLWSVLRNLHDRRDVNNRYDTVCRFMKQAFPNFRGLLIEQTGLGSVYGSILEENRRKPVPASGISDGHLQMLLHLAALFGDMDQETLLFFDEPEISLHPHAIGAFAEAVRYATEYAKKQVCIATHSPVLISQFELPEIIACHLDHDNATQMRRASDMPEIADLLEQYAAGSLYMSEMIAGQSREGVQ